MRERGLGGGARKKFCSRKGEQGKNFEEVADFFGKVNDEKI